MNIELSELEIKNLIEVLEFQIRELKNNIFYLKNKLAIYQSILNKINS